MLGHPVDIWAPRLIWRALGLGLHLFYDRRSSRLAQDT
jgi:hypothetical protein